MRRETTLGMTHENDVTAPEIFDSTAPVGGPASDAGTDASTMGRVGETRSSRGVPARPVCRGTGRQLLGDVPHSFAESRHFANGEEEEDGVTKALSGGKVGFGAALLGDAHRRSGRRVDGTSRRRGLLRLRRGLDRRRLYCGADYLLRRGHDDRTSDIFLASWVL